ncbi:MAG TPA: hypothetical protein VMT52_02155, partial [Planctomycetota bacterium]|nr:hypothetical protein [Planctomycetota bacterium]
VAAMPGEGPTWLNGLTVVPDENGREQLFAVYMKIKPPLEIYQYGLARFDDTANTFHSVADFGRDPHVAPLGHPIRLRDGPTEYVHFGSTIPFIRAPARAEALQRIEEYEAFTCLRPGSRLDKPEIDRGPDGAVRHAWKRNTPAVDPREQERLVKQQFLKPHEGLFQLCDRDTGRPFQAHFGSVYWNEHRKRFLLICVQSGGTSHLGEVWYAEGDSPLGPWAYAVKILTHDRYSFYNPKRHPMFDQEGGRVVYFEGTYTHSFSGNPEQTPRYDYNQIMYRLDLDDPRLTLPVAMYRSTGEGSVRLASRRARAAEDPGAPPDLTSIAFFACERPREGLIPVHVEAGSSGQFALTLEPGDAGGRRPIAFHAMPASAAIPPPSAVPLHEYAHDDGRREYSIDPGAKLPGFRRLEKPLCLVWRNPFAPR